MYGYGVTITLKMTIFFHSRLTKYCHCQSLKAHLCVVSLFIHHSPVEWGVEPEFGDT